ncbi:hypothetical protein EA462_03450 [Natrarchaeobius halalkaliphilus]|uniref:Uncharacterized protein n=1 Tax=Natrarchaeobius halalkaliphilus TaxID=1679091 RepID=A0A3N6MAA7_9EURY|nr:hypothetical protein [Natrarchaeobius halalkaliphilus]RQG93260.1 hypothetical protein EA462_03450 [Natrarchaeobius halalkaliphilus]
MNRRAFLGMIGSVSTGLAGCLALLDVEGDEPNYISISNRYTDPVTIDVTITNVDTGKTVYDEVLGLDGFAGADVDGAAPRKRPDLGIGEGFEATVTAATDQDSDELTEDVGPSGGSSINVLHNSNAELSISRDVV